MKINLTKIKALTFIEQKSVISVEYKMENETGSFANKFSH